MSAHNDAAATREMLADLRRDWPEGVPRGEMAAVARQIRDECDIYVHYDLDKGAFIFAARRDSPPRSMTKLQAESNGTIVDAKTLRVVAVGPPLAFNGKISALPKEFDCEPIMDGVMTNLYHTDAWYMGSANGIDISDKTWIGPTTYRAALEDLLLRVYDLRLDDLDPTLCYSIVFHSNAVQAYQAEERVWLIDVHDIAAANAGAPPRAFEPLCAGDRVATRLDRPPTTRMTPAELTAGLRAPGVLGYIYRPRGRNFALIFLSGLMKDIHATANRFDDRREYRQQMRDPAQHAFRFACMLCAAYGHKKTRATFARIYPHLAPSMELVDQCKEAAKRYILWQMQHGGRENARPEVAVDAERLLADAQEFTKRVAMNPFEGDLASVVDDLVTFNKNDILLRTVWRALDAAPTKSAA